MGGGHIPPIEDRKIQAAIHLAEVASFFELLPALFHKYASTFSEIRFTVSTQAENHHLPVQSKAYGQGLVHAGL
jgi:hypothetical protein